MIIFLKGTLEVLRYFIDEMAVRTKDAVFLDTTDPGFFRKIEGLDREINENTHVITFNNAGVNLTVGGGKNYWELKKVKLHNIQVDAPIWYTDTLDLQLSCMQIVSVDGYHSQFIKHYYPVYSNAVFVPHGGSMSPGHIRNYDDREIEVLYLGRKEEAGKQNTELPMFADKGEALHEIFMELMLENLDLPVEKLMDICVQEVFPDLTERMQIACIGAVYKDLVRYIRGMYQEKIIEALARADIPVTIYSGGGWHKLEEKYAGITVRERVSSAECIRLTGNSKICLNMQPWFKDGAHERVYNAMLNEAVCVTDTSEYLLRNFTHGHDIVFYELEHLEQLAENVKYLLENPESAKSIIRNQKRRASNQTWADRLDEIIGGGGVIILYMCCIGVRPAQVSRGKA